MSLIPQLEIDDSTALVAPGSSRKYVAARGDSAGNSKVSLGTRIAGEDINGDVQKVETRYSYTNITTNTTTTVKSGSGFLHAFTINNPAAITVTGLTLTVYDNTAASGTLIGTWFVPIGTSALPFDITINVSFGTGLTIVTAGPTVAANVTVASR